MKNSLLAIAIAVLMIGDSAGAALTMSGSLDVDEFAPGGSFTSSSLVLNQSTLIISETGTFASTVPNFSELTSYTGTLTGLSATPTTEGIDDFLAFSTPNSSFGAPGTTPNDRFEFDLETLSEVEYIASPNPQFASFVGTGMLVDSTGAYASAPAELDLSFSAEGNYSFVLDVAPVVPAPEPRYGIYSGIFAVLLVLFNPIRRQLLRLRF